ncbi:MAG: ATPase [Deltaproteobacteria bacterium RBG_16_49_23]|nr:MAG: ATPase [Deltaproteobacteria bacterium RBG_16_49_23]
MEIIDRFLQTPKTSFFLFGPRGTGKSTFVHRHFKNAIYIDLLDPERVRFFSAMPERLREMIDVQPESGFIVIDEVQRVPELLPVVHSLIEAKKGWKFVLTGSSARKLKRTGIDLLGGRALLHTLHPFMAGELGRYFNFDKALLHGLLPVVVASEDPAEVLRSYAALYLREEVQMEGLVRNIGNFSRFLEAISFSHASILNVSNVARECEVERKVVEGYVGILEDILLSWQLPIFTKRAKRELIVRPKFYLFDTGVFRSLRPKGPLDRAEEIEGQALEGLVAQHLKAWTAYSKGQRELFYWRTRSGAEVDFVVYGSEGLWGVEVKNARKIYPADLRGLRSFKEEYPDSKRLCLYRGRDRLMKDGILCLPCMDFLKELHPDRLLDEAFT